MDSINKNYVDMDEYPITTELQVHIGLLSSADFLVSDEEGRGWPWPRPLWSGTTF
jgi:uncharacterized protein YfiM (DUF2279 family)